MLNYKKAIELYDYCPNTGIVRSKVKRRQAEVGTILGSPHGKGYLTVWYINRNYFLHRVIWLLVTGNWPRQEIDHIDGNRSNNSWANLREASTFVNTKNQKMRESNSSGVIGVSRSSSVSKPWRATIVVNRNQINLGNFKTVEEASISRKKAEAFYGFHENHGRTV